jgi:hypothetical protein
MRPRSCDTGRELFTSVKVNDLQSLMNSLSARASLTSIVSHKSLEWKNRMIWRKPRLSRNRPVPEANLRFCGRGACSSVAPGTCRRALGCCTVDGWRCFRNDRDLFVQAVTQMATGLETSAGECVNCISVEGTIQLLEWQSCWTDGLIWC